MADQRANDKRIKEILVKYGEDLVGSVWRVQGTAVINHKVLERIAAKAQIKFDEPKVIRAERDEAVIQVTGRLGERVEWTIGEALIKSGDKPGNYQVSGKQAAYVYAMAEKRAKDRVILKLIELHGYVYSEEEADDFKRQGTRTQDQMGNDNTEHDEDGVIDDSPPATDTSAVRGSTEAGTEAYSGAARVGQKPEDSVAAKVKANIQKRETWEAVQEFMTSERVQEALLSQMTKDEAVELRKFAHSRMVSLGYAPPEKGTSGDPSSRKDNGVVSTDPMHPTNLNTLHTSVSTAIKDAKSTQEVEDLIEAEIKRRGLDWDALPQEVMDRVNKAADTKIAHIKKSRK